MIRINTPAMRMQDAVAHPLGRAARAVRCHDRLPTTSRRSLVSGEQLADAVTNLRSQPVERVECPEVLVHLLDP